ncbi:MAG TPA: hypothetical protein VN213_05600 [Solirubrobacteraceae bacterium]|nr:hypothetical protein [Solirubrobacteraceae bacterium]
MLRVAVAATLAAVLLALAGCGGNDGPQDPVSQVPQDRGLQDQVRAALTPRAADFPKTGGKTLQALADEIGGGSEMAMAGSVYVAGRENRLAFGVIDRNAGFLYAPTALYVARTPESPARGPFLAPADVLVTDVPFRSKQAATEEDPFAAVYAANVPLGRAGRYYVMSVSLVDGEPVAAPGDIRVVAAARDRVPDVGERAPRVATDTVESARGDLAAIDTREPPSPDLHRTSLADVLGEKPVALLFATPQLCQSRVCGPVVDEALQLKTRYGDRIEFIHQEVYVDNDPNKGVRPPMRAFNLPSEPWLFVIGRDGRITERLEGSFGLGAFERALKTAL